MTRAGLTVHGLLVADGLQQEETVMTDQRLTHDVAWATAVACADCVTWNTDADRAEAIHTFYEAVRAGFEKWQELKARELRRLAKNAYKPEGN